MPAVEAAPTQPVALAEVVGTQVSPQNSDEESPEEGQTEKSSSSFEEVLELSICLIQ